jgi:hypothetical protein
VSALDRPPRGNSEVVPEVKIGLLRDPQASRRGDHRWTAEYSCRAVVATPWKDANGITIWRDKPCRSHHALLDQQQEVAARRMNSPIKVIVMSTVLRTVGPQRGWKRCGFNDTDLAQRTTCTLSLRISSV